MVCWVVWVNSTIFTTVIVDITTSRVVAHFTQVAFTAQGIPEEKEDIDDEEFDEEEFEDEPSALLNDRRSNSSLTPISPRMAPAIQSPSSVTHHHPGHSHGGHTPHTTHSRTSSMTKEEEKFKENKEAEKIKKKKSIVEKASSRVAKFTNEFKSSFIKHETEPVKPTVSQQPLRPVQTVVMGGTMTGTISWTASSVLVLVLVLDLACLCARGLDRDTFLVFMTVTNFIGVVFCLRAKNLAPLKVTLSGGGVKAAPQTAAHSHQENEVDFPSDGAPPRGNRLPNSHKSKVSLLFCSSLSQSTTKKKTEKQNDNKKTNKQTSWECRGSGAQLSRYWNYATKTARH